MAFKDDIQTRMSQILDEPWASRNGEAVPKTEDVALKNGAVRMEAAFLYADLADSTLLQKRYKDTFSSKVIRMYLAGASSIIREYGGHIKSFDGDRVMGVFPGKAKCNKAVLAAFAIQWLVEEVINPLLKQHLERTQSISWQVSHGVGIDVGETFITRAGVRNTSGQTTHNDLIFTKKAPNVAAKLSALRGDEEGPLTITREVFSKLNASQKTFLYSDTPIWRGPTKVLAGPYLLDVFQASYWRHK